MFWIHVYIAAAILLVLAWCVGAIWDEIRDHRRRRAMDRIVTFTGVSGPPTMTLPATRVGVSFSAVGPSGPIADLCIIGRHDKCSGKYRSVRGEFACGCECHRSHPACADHERQGYETCGCSE